LIIRFYTLDRDPVARTSALRGKQTSKQANKQTQSICVVVAQGRGLCRAWPQAKSGAKPFNWKMLSGTLALLLLQVSMIKITSSLKILALIECINGK
jgi:hypothetical protein